MTQHSTGQLLCYFLGKDDICDRTLVIYIVLFIYGGGGGIIFKVQEQLHVYDTTEAARCQSVTTVDIGESPVTVIAGPTGVARPPQPHQTGRLSSGGLLYRRHFGGALVSVLAQTSPVLN